MKNILIIFGTRPEAIKMSPLIKTLKKDDEFKVITCTSGQHKELVYQVLDLFEIIPDYDFELMSKTKSLSLSEISSKIMDKLNGVIATEKPDAIIVQGDTTTAMISSLCGFYHKIPIIHLEAGLRTNNIYSPFPEEVNRKIISTYSQINLCPTERNKLNLISEGIKDNTIYVTGNTVIDSLLLISEKLEKNSTLISRTKKTLSEKLDLSFLSNDYILVTCHRRENHGEGLYSICKAIKEISLKYPGLSIVFPVHPNPNIKNFVHKNLSNLDNIIICDPFDYVEFIFLLKYCKLIISDSGGIQEEAPTLGKPVLVTRNETERQEAVESGTVLLVGSDTSKIIKNTSKLLDDPLTYKKMASINNPYGNGNASKLISGILKKHEY
jgi:UDP-N-acetylglucosamine 2-epimerase (non-hydrolysing)